MGLFSCKRPSGAAFPCTRAQLELVLANVVRHVILSVTEQCNLRCEYCAFSGAYPNDRVHSNRVMTLAVGEKAIDLLMNKSAFIFTQADEPLTLGFYGGEPLLQFDLIRKLICYARELYPDRQERLSFAITTNLTTNRADAIHYLAANNFNLLVSLDGPFWIHDRYRVSANRVGSFASTVRNLELLKRCHEEYYADRVSFSTVIAPPYDLGAIKRFFDETPLVRGHRVNVTFADADNTTFFDRFPDMAEIKRTLSSQLAALRSSYLGSILREEGVVAGSFDEFLGKRMRDIVNRPVTRLPDVLFPNGCCLPGVHRTFVSVDGRLHICEKVGCNLPIGNVDVGFDVDAISGILSEYAGLVAKQCCDCWAVRFCSLCFDTALQGSTFSESQQSVHCAAVRSSVESGLKEYCSAKHNSTSPLVDLFPRRHAVPSGMDLALRFLKQRAGGKSLNA